MPRRMAYSAPPALRLRRLAPPPRPKAAIATRARCGDDGGITPGRGENMAGPLALALGFYARVGVGDGICCPFHHKSRPFCRLKRSIAGGFQIWQYICVSALAASDTVDNVDTVRW